MPGSRNACAGCDVSHRDRPAVVPRDNRWLLHDELQLFVRAGFTAAEALRAATWDAAEFMGKQNDFGSVATGKMADLVLLDADPLRNIHNTTRISEVFLGGKEFDRAALDAMLKRAEAAASNFRLP